MSRSAYRAVHWWNGLIDWLIDGSMKEDWSLIDRCLYRRNLMVLLSSLSSRDCARKFCPITIFHARHGKSPLARLALAPWLLARHLVQACSDTAILQYLQYLQYPQFTIQIIWYTPLALSSSRAKLTTFSYPLICQLNYFIICILPSHFNTVL